MNAYFELSDAHAPAYVSKYFAAYDVRKSSVIGGAHRGFLIQSERVWLEDEKGVRFLKHRTEDVQTAVVDLKEFFWIKLKCKEIL